MDTIATEKVTAAQIASRLKLSPTTVSLVLNGRDERHRISKRTSQRVLAAAREMKYRPNVLARQLAGKRGNVVGVLINTQAVADVRLIQAMEILAAERGIRFIVGHAVGTREQVQDYLDDFQARGVDGIISIFHNHPDYSETVLHELSRFERVVFYEKPDATSDGFGSDACYVAVDFYEVGRLGVQHLIDRGRLRIGLVFNDLVFPYAVARRRAYEAVLTAEGREVEEGLIWVMDEQEAMQGTEPFTPERALRVVDELVLAKGVDGIVAVNDVYAARLNLALGQRGQRVPEDVALVGAGDLEIGTLTEPPLTTIDHRVEPIARAMVGMLFELLETGSVPEDRRAVVIQPELIVRGSS